MGEIRVTSQSDGSHIMVEAKHVHSIQNSGSGKFCYIYMHGPDKGGDGKVHVVKELEAILLPALVGAGFKPPSFGPKADVSRGK